MYRGSRRITLNVCRGTGSPRRVRSRPVQFVEQFLLRPLPGGREGERLPDERLIYRAVSWDLQHVHPARDVPVPTFANARDWVPTRRSCAGCGWANFAARAAAAFSARNCSTRPRTTTARRRSTGQLQQNHRRRTRPGGGEGDDAACAGRGARATDRARLELPAGDEMFLAGQIATEAHRYSATTVAIESGKRALRVRAGPQPVRTDADTGHGVQRTGTRAARSNAAGRGRKAEVVFENADDVDGRHARLARRGRDTIGWRTS